MGIVSGIRILNNLLAGTLSGAQLETLLATGANEASFTQLLYSPRYVRVLFGSASVVAALAVSNAALAAVFASPVRRVLYDNATASGILLASANAKAYMLTIAQTATITSTSHTSANSGRTFFLQQKTSYSSTSSFAGASVDSYSTNSTAYVDRFARVRGLTHRISVSGYTSSVTYLDME